MSVTRRAAPQRRLPCPHQTQQGQHERIVALRRERRTYQHISQIVGLSQSAVARRLKRAGLHRLSALEPAPPVRRYTHDASGDLLHLDIKKLGRF